MEALATPLYRIYNILFAAYGPQHWWPGDTPFEIMAGAILTQATAWSNAEQAIANLKQANVLAPCMIRNLPQEELAKLIRPAGYHNVKAERLKALVAWLSAANNTETAFGKNTATLRAELLAAPGIGPETADSILLYAAAKPVFVIDAYTRRILRRLGLASGKESYEMLQQHFMEDLPAEAVLYNEYHALLVRLGKEACLTTPRCRRCCLDKFCPKKI